MKEAALKKLKSLKIKRLLVEKMVLENVSCQVQDVQIQSSMPIVDGKFRLLFTALLTPKFTKTHQKFAKKCSVVLPETIPFSGVCTPTNNPTKAPPDWEILLGEYAVPKEAVQ